MDVHKRRNQHQLIGNIKICVTRRKSLAVEVDRLRARQRNNAQIRASLQDPQVFLQGGVVVFVRIRLNYRDHRIGTHKACKIVDMAVRIVADNAILKPNHVGHPQVITQGAFDFLLSATRIAGLHIRQQALLGRQKFALPVDVNTAAFKNKRWSE